MSTTTDTPPNKPSPQLSWQQRKQAAGLCITCGRVPPEPGHVRCTGCYGPYPGRQQYDWDDVDWSLRDMTIAVLLRCTARAVGYQRRKRGIASHRQGRPTKPRQMPKA